MTLGGPRKIIAISACLVLAGGLVWGCTHQVRTVLPNSNSTLTANFIQTQQNSTQTNTNAVIPDTNKVYTEHVNATVAETSQTTELELNNGEDQVNGEVAVEGEDGAGEVTEGEAAQEVDVEARERDVERVARITQIQQALESYKVQHQAFPEVLEMLAEGFLAEIPKDVDGDDFSYTPIGALPAQFYDLCYELEVGTESITAGYHCASPEGVAHP